jgi:signal transduction histidine kinase
MKRSLLLLLAALAASDAVMAVIGGADAVILSTKIVLPIGAVALLIAHATNAQRLRPRTLSGRFELGLALALGQLLAALVIGALVMFVSVDDAWTTIGVLVFAALIAIRAAQLLSGGVVKDIRGIRDGLQAVERGDRGVHVSATSSRELGDLAHAANSMIQALSSEERHRDAADAARRQVIAAVSHDLRTPLTSLRLLTQALDDDLVDAETARRYVDTMSANVRALGSLVDDLFELSRLDATDYAWSTEAVPLAQLIEGTIASVCPEAEECCVAVSAEIPAGLAPAQANPEKLQRVLANLLQNAIHHTPPDGSVLVSARQEDGAVEIAVADTGDGISADDRSHVFEPFYRGGDDAARATAGTGLGLAIARAIVEAHGGRIWLADAATGTRVCFTLPLAFA